jgi:hypothetical protein
MGIEHVSGEGLGVENGTDVSWCNDTYVGFGGLAPLGAV